MTGTLLTAFLALMVTGIPVAIAMAGASLIYILVTGNSPAMVVVHRMISGIDSFPLLAVPFFILAGNLMNNAGITNRIYNFALALVGWMKGGLGHVNIIGSVIFAGMSGTAIADAAGLGTIEIKAMRDHGYSKEFSVGVKRPVVMPPIKSTGVMIGSTASNFHFQSERKSATIATPVATTGLAPASTASQMTSGKAMTIASSRPALPTRLHRNLMSAPQWFLCA